MPKRTRTLILIGLICLFLIGTPMIVLLSKGYRFDTKHRRFVQTGALHLKTKPEQTIISINGKEKRIAPPPFLYNGTVFKNLIPDTYEVVIAASSSLAWTKQVAVEPLMVTKMTRIVLPFSQPQTTALFTTTTPFQVIGRLNDQALLLLFNKKIVVALSSTEPEQTPKQIFPLLSSTTTLPLSEKIISAVPSASSRYLLITTNATSYLTSGETVLPLTKPLQLIKAQNKGASLRFVWHPTDDAILFVFAPNQNYWIHLPEMNVEKFLTEKIIGWNTTGTNPYFLSNKGTLYEFSTQLQPTSTPLAVIDPSLFARQPLDIYAIGKKRFILHEPSGMLLFWDIESPTSELIDTSVSKVAISSDTSRLAYLTNDNQLTVYFLERVFDDTSYNQYEKIVLGKIPTGTSPAALYFANDNWDTLTATNQGVIITEIDKRLPVNSWVVSLKQQITPLIFQKHNATLVWQASSTIFSSLLLP